LGRVQGLSFLRLTKKLNEGSATVNSSFPLPPLQRH
jgi:hypothetical protein